MHPLSFLGGLGASEWVALLGVPLLYILPLWLSFRNYGEGRTHWRTVSIVATLFFSWMGYILVSAMAAGTKGYVEGRTGKPSE
jgi:TctA family transporter